MTSEFLYRGHTYHHKTPIQISWIDGSPDSLGMLLLTDKPEIIVILHNNENAQRAEYHHHLDQYIPRDKHGYNYYWIMEHRFLIHGIPSHVKSFRPLCTKPKDGD